MEKRERRLFTLDEKREIEKYLNLGYSHKKIGEIIGRHQTSISREISRGGVPYNAEASRDRRILLRKHSGENKSQYEKLIERVEILEMQLEIISTHLKVNNDT